jgi:hypothetical protein
VLSSCKSSAPVMVTGCYVGLYLRRNEPSCPAFRRGIS